MKELLFNNGEKGRPLWVMIHSKIYDVTKFRHPGGRSLLINDDNEIYEDKGIEFDSVNHSQEAIEEREKLCIGILHECEDKQIKVEEKKDFIVELQPTNNYPKDEEINNKKVHIMAFMLTCILTLIIILLILNF